MAGLHSSRPTHSHREVLILAILIAIVLLLLAGDRAVLSGLAVLAV